MSLTTVSILAVKCTCGGTVQQTFADGLFTCKCLACPRSTANASKTWEPSWTVPVSKSK